MSRISRFAIACTCTLLASTTVSLVTEVPGAVTSSGATGQSAATAGAPMPSDCGLCVLAPAGVSLADSGNGAVTVQGASVAVDSASHPAVSVSGNGTIVAPTVGVVGTVSISGNGKISNLKTGIASVTDPLAGVPAPSVPRPTTIPSVSVSGGTQTIPPGVYQNISVTGQGRLGLTPGTYVILGQFSASGNGQVSGSGVSLYLACGSYPVACRPGAKGASVSLAGNGKFNLGGPTSGCLPLTIFSDPNNTSAISLSGNGSDALSGIVYARSGAVALSGNGSAFVVQGHVIAGTVALSGNGNVTLTPPGLIACILALAPSMAKVVVGTKQELDATLTSATGSPVSGQTVDVLDHRREPNNRVGNDRRHRHGPFRLSGHRIGNRQRHRISDAGRDPPAVQHGDNHLDTGHPPPRDRPVGVAGSIWNSGDRHRNPLWRVCANRLDQLERLRLERHLLPEPAQQQPPDHPAERKLGRLAAVHAGRTGHIPVHGQLPRRRRQPGRRGQLR